MGWGFQVQPGLCHAFLLEALSTKFRSMAPAIPENEGYLEGQVRKEVDANHASKYEPWPDLLVTRLTSILITPWLAASPLPL